MNLDCYISVIATFIAVCATIVTGFQIFNFIDINRKLSKIKRAQNETKIQLECQRNITRECICIANGLEIWNNSDYIKTRGSMAFLEFHRALLFSIEIDRDDYDWLFKYLDKCINALTFNDFDTSGFLDNNQKQRINDGIDGFLNLVKQDEKNLLSNKNFVKIKHQYYEMRNMLEKKLNEVTSMEQE